MTPTLCVSADRVADTLWIDGTAEDGQPWTLSTGDVMVWQNFSPGPRNPSRTSILVNRTTTEWVDAFSNELHSFVCEAPIGKDHILVD